MVENISLPDELQKMLDQRISMNMIGDMGKYTQFRWRNPCRSRPRTKADGAAGIGVGLGAGLTMGQTMMNAMQARRKPPAPSAPVRQRRHPRRNSA